MSRSRREFQKHVKVAAFERSRGLCENPRCGQKLFPGNIEYDHAKEDFFAGTPTLENCLVLCRACHREKSGYRAAVIAKTRRQSAMNAGIRKPSTLSHPTLRRRMDGTVVERRN